MQQSTAGADQGVPEKHTEPDPSEIKKAINNIIWSNARPEVTLREAEKAAGEAFDAVWTLMVDTGGA
jgi:hypothetical protein